MMISIALSFFFAATQTVPGLVRQVSESGRVVEIAASPSRQVSPTKQIAPGAPPLLSFRLFEGRQRSRYAGLDLVIDDAGH